MSPRGFTNATLALALLLLWSGPAPARAGEEFVFHHENVMGTSLELRVRADTAAAAGRAEAAVLDEIDRLSSIFSGYDSSSEFSRWQHAAGVPTKVSPELFEVLRRSEHWIETGKGAFDPRAQALTELWSRCAREDRLPTRAERDGALELMRKRPWQLDESTGTATRLSSCPLSLNGIAKGYIVERACDAALKGPHGVRGVLLNVGGDLRVAGDITGTIGVASPRGDSETTPPIARIEVRDLGVATSGNYQRGLKIQGNWYSHLFDPRTGEPVDRVVSATVVAGRLTDADALAKVFSVLPVDESLRLARTLPGVDCLLVSGDGTVSRSDGFGRFERTVAVAAGAPNDGADRKPSWNEDFELVVNFEITAPKGTPKRYRRPYLAIWAEDKDKLAVRTLTLWVQARPPGPRWIPDLKHWYQADQVRLLTDKTDMVQTTSRATRPPGKYKVIWDGKDDRGKPLPPGPYTICIEAAREHGSHQLIRRELTLADRPFTEELKGNVEIGSASIEYRRKGAAR